MTYLSDLTTTRDSLLSKLKTLAASSDTKPSYMVDGRSVSWDTHRASLIREIKELNQMVINAGGAVEISTIALG